MVERRTLRTYQERLAQAGLLSNTIVVLPTGAGKTLVAAEVINKRGGTALFLVPTCLLVEQQAAAVRAWLGPQSVVAEFMGGMQIPSGFDVLVSTPKSFHVTQSKGVKEFGWHSFQTIVMDEVHHVLKEHPYRKLALALRRSKATPRVIGLTASLTYCITKERMKASVQRICEELTVTSPVIIIPQEELIAAGYHGSTSEPDLRLMPVPFQLIDGLVPEVDRQPHKALPTFFGRIKNGSATPLARRLFSCIEAMEHHMSRSDPSFRSPLSKSNSASWGQYAHSRAEQTKHKQGNRSLSPLYAELEHWYEALKVLVTSWEESQDHVVPMLQMFGVPAATTGVSVMWGDSVSPLLATFWANAPDTTPRFDCLSEVLLTEYQREGRGSDFRGIIFVERRISTHVWAHLIHQDRELSQLFTPASLYAANSAVTPSLTLTRGESKRRVQAFRRGDVNLLIATAAAEEGMDIPEANCVICFDNIIHGVALVQRRGRAREADSSFIIMSERRDRPVSFLATGEQNQQTFLQSFEPVGEDRTSEEKRRKAQTSRELTARPLLMEKIEMTTVVHALHAYCQKTKTSLEESFTPLTVNGGDVTCLLAYNSAVRHLKVEGTGKGNKRAKQVAAMKLWGRLTENAR
eukprot:GHVN01012123.1.p1 GENE.GHVN01012123.1~~GHVN01012123.1.p1  ORF type:complete len:634 (-),score=45.91 GHVN01012123.1:209-2110(-)